MELENTDKPITLANLLKDIDGKNACEMDRFRSFFAAIGKRDFTVNDKFLLGREYNFLERFIKIHPEVGPWLIEHGFAKEKKPEFKPLLIEVNTREEAEELRQFVGYVTLEYPFGNRILQKLKDALEG